MSTPLRDRKKCTNVVRARLVALFLKAVKNGYDRPHAKCVAMYVENRLQQGGQSSPSYEVAQDQFRRGVLSGGKETAKEFDRLTGGRYA